MSARIDRRALAVVLTATLIAVGGTVLHSLPSAPDDARPDPRRDPQGHADSARREEIRIRFEQAVLMLHAREYEHALVALHRVLELAPSMPEAHANAGYALLGLKRTAAARDFFEGAIALNPTQANAYYGLAVALEELGDRPGAIGAMRSFLHLAKDEDPRHLAKARAALWEWEALRVDAKPRR
jgi:tetratricopeptide (TPR) repeat protein